MKVAAILGERQAGLVDVPDPTPKEDWVVVKIHASPMSEIQAAFETSASHESSKIILKPWE